ncbi:ABC transporter permease [Ferrimonas aestuarii]|uniref:ABC transporter permease n=1 Tax=Ferrimonas aestuarii TaxID=2569539 RepID=A0A4U1BR76_9GAMM|nr:ABC transporter permease [Ferrimonas aestuarii]TKB57260.1 ABC transporter permease [Ferrimonas aestuarii]
MIDVSWLLLTSFLFILVIPWGIDRYFGLGLAREGAVAVIRMVAQLVLVGLYLNYLFALDSPWVNGGWVMLMIIIGASSVSAKSNLPRKLAMAPIATGMAVAMLPLLMVIIIGVIQPSHFHDARYLIPLAGMLLGNSLGALIMALHRLVTAFEERKGEYHGALALGATPRQACAPFVEHALRQASAPILASTSTTGLVTLPGMMTGQILGGADPLVAIKYQMLIMVAILVMVTSSAALTLALAVGRLTDRNGRLLVPPPAKAK